MEKAFEAVAKELVAKVNANDPGCTLYALHGAPPRSARRCPTARAPEAPTPSGVRRSERMVTSTTLLVAARDHRRALRRAGVK